MIIIFRFKTRKKSRKKRTKNFYVLSLLKQCGNWKNLITLSKTLKISINSFFISCIQIIFKKFFSISQKNTLYIYRILNFDNFLFLKYLFCLKSDLCKIPQNVKFDLKVNEGHIKVLYLFLWKEFFLFSLLRTTLTYVLMYNYFKKQLNKIFTKKTYIRFSLG